MDSGDGCAIVIVPGATPGAKIARHHSRQDGDLLAAVAALADPHTYRFTSSDDARATLPSVYYPVIERFGMSALTLVPFPSNSPVAGMVTVMRDGSSLSFEPDDLATIDTCIAYVAMALENALRFDAERATRSQLETILEHLPISIIVADPAGVFTHMNQSALKMIPELRGVRTVAENR